MYLMFDAVNVKLKLPRCFLFRSNGKRLEGVGGWGIDLMGELAIKRERERERERK